MTWTWVSYRVACPGFGACCTSFTTGASRQAGSFNRPSSVIEMDEVANAVATGPSSERALASVAVANKTKNKCHRTRRRVIEARTGGTGRGLSFDTGSVIAPGGRTHRGRRIQETTCLAALHRKSTSHTSLV